MLRLLIIAANTYTSLKVRVGARCTTMVLQRLLITIILKLAGEHG